MEPKGILPDELIQQLEQPDNEVMKNLTRFCGSTKQELLDVLYMRNKKISTGEVLVDGKVKSDVRLRYGYEVSKQHIGRKRRYISNPALGLRTIQDHIKMHLEKIPVSLVATGGKKGDSMIKNAELHKENPYLITMDLKSAYPSIGTSRVYANIQGAIGKALTIRCPLLEHQEEKNLFIRAVTHLLVHVNELPQGALTSSQVLNIVLAKMDSQIEKKLAHLIPHSVYSRYIDDIAVSFPHYSTMEVLKQQLGTYEEQLDLLRHNTSISQDIPILDALVQKFSEEKFIITDKYELHFLQEFIVKFVGLLKKTYCFVEKVETRIGVLHQYQKQISYSHDKIKNLRDELMDVIGSNGFAVKRVKTKLYTPQSGGMREITGIAYTADGRRGISSVKRGAMKRFFSDWASLSARELFQNPFYCSYMGQKRAGRNRHSIDLDNKFARIKVGEIDAEDKLRDAEKIIRILEGKYAHLRQVYGKDNIPKALEESFLQARSRRAGRLPSPPLMPALSEGKSVEDTEEGDDLPF